MASSSASRALLAVFLFTLAAFIDALPLSSWSIEIDPANTTKFAFWWNKCVGSGHASLALRADWKTHLKYIHDEIGFTSVRCHGILDDDIGVVNGINDYSFINIDKIYDYLLSIDMKPYVEISFMPDVFASGTLTKMHYKGNITPPSSWETWYAFIQEWVQHLVDRYGLAEVQTWKFEVWNEPNCGFYEQGGCCGCTGCSSLEAYLPLYANTSRAIKAVSTALQVGGPSTSGLCWLTDFLTAVVKNDIPFDFLSSHQYPNTQQVNKYGVNWYFNQINVVNEEIAAFNQKNNNIFKDLPFILSEYNSGISYNQIGYDNHDRIFASAFMISMMYRLQPLIKGQTANAFYEYMSYWTFDDVFEEQGFWSSPFWISNTTKNTYFGMMTKRGLLKPVFRAMQLMTTFGSELAMNTQLLNGDITNNDNTIIVYCLEHKSTNNRYSIFVSNWNYYQSPITETILEINLVNTVSSNAPKTAIAYRVDNSNANVWQRWQSMGQPTYPTPAQLQALNDSSQLVPSPMHFVVASANSVKFNFSVPAYGVVVIDVQY